MNQLLVIKKSLAVVLTFVVLASTFRLATAQEARVSPSRNSSAAATQPQGPTNPVELEAFLDTLFAQQMGENHIAGAAVAVVKDGELFFAKGYGYADLEKGTPVDATKTLFRIGSVGKVLTWTAVMQLVDQGKLDLDADINTYLDFRIPDTYPQPVTLRNLLTHTSGFEDRFFGSAVSDVKDLVPVREWLTSPVWARIRPPGDAGYSNYNAILAGYIVARVSGQPYDQYIQEHIFDPLGMVHSTAQAIIPSDLRANASVGYTYEDGIFQAFPDYTAQPAGMPSGGHEASVTDMARFMIALLQGGRYNDASFGEARILKDVTAQQMQSTLYTPDPRLLGTAYGFFDWSDNNQRTLGHTGYSPPMHSVLLLLPDRNLGVFAAFNSDGGSNLTVQHFGLQRAFFDHYFPAAAVEPIQPSTNFAKQAGRFVGSYNAIRSYTTLAKIQGLFGGGYPAEISDSGDGILTFSLQGISLRFAEVEPLYFRQVDGPFALVFREDDQGRITHVFTDLMPEYALEKLNWYETSGFNLTLVLGCVFIFLSMIPITAFRVIRNRRLGGDRKPASRASGAGHWIFLGISILNLLFLVVMVWGVMKGTTNILLDPILIVKIVLGLGVLSAVLTLGVLIYTVLAWKNSYWGLAGRVYYTLVTVAAVAFVWFLNYWNMLGWRY